MNRRGESISSIHASTVLWTPDSIFNKLIPDEFVRSRSLLLNAQEEGLSIESEQTPFALEKGSGLAKAFRCFPLEALQTILFGRSTITLDEVLSILTPDYCNYEGDCWEGTDSDMIQHREQQEHFFDGDFKRYLKEESSKKSNFLEEFVQFCTGMNYIPYVAPGEETFKIIVEFNFMAPEPGGHPLAHTCVNTIRLPGMDMYFGDYDVFCQKMEESLAHCNRFDME